MTPLESVLHSLQNRREFFDYMAEDWHYRTWGLSLYASMFKDRAYREILSLGWDAVPWILNRWSKAPKEPWFHALHKITGDSPDFGQDFRNNMEAVRQEWFLWADRLQIAWRDSSSLPLRVWM